MLFEKLFSFYFSPTNGLELIVPTVSSVRRRPSDKRPSLHSAWKREDMIWLNVFPFLQCGRDSLTSDTEDGGAFGPSEGVLGADAVLAHVSGADAKDQHGANATGVGDVIVGISVEADVIPIPRDVRFGISLHSTAHVALVAFGRGVKLQRYDEGRSTLQIANRSGREAHHKLFCRKGDEVGLYFT